MMNLHFFIYIKHPERFSRAGFEAYCREFGLQATVPEDFSLTDPPVNNLFFMLIDDPDFTKGQEDGVCRLNIVVDPGAAVVSPRHKPLSIWDKLRNKRRVAFRAAIRNVPTVWRLCESLYGQMDDVPVFFLAGYLLRACGGVLEAPGVDQYYLCSEELDPVVARILEELREMAQRDEWKA